jgi:magnesium transporter
MMRSLYHTQGGHTRADLNPAEFATALQDVHGLLWVDLSGEPPDTCEPILRETFGFHPLAVDDALEESHVPKVDDWGPYLYLTLHAVVLGQQNSEPDDEPLSTLELDVFLGPNYLITYQAQPIATIDRVWTACQRDERHLQRGAAFLLYKLADELVADYMPVIDKIDDALDQIEDQVFDDPKPSLLEELFTLKRALLRLRRIIAPQREVLNRLGRGDFDLVESEERVFFRDVYDHLVRMYDITESLRDLVSSALDTYLSVVNNRMNDVMKTLTIITTLFMPLSFLTGFFGMNFFQPVTSLDVWTGRTVFSLTLSAMALLPVGMWLWMRRRALL